MGSHDISNGIHRSWTLRLIACVYTILSCLYLVATAEVNFCDDYMLGLAESVPNLFRLLTLPEHWFLLNATLVKRLHFAILTCVYMVDYLGAGIHERPALPLCLH